MTTGPGGDGHPPDDRQHIDPSLLETEARSPAPVLVMLHGFMGSRQDLEGPAREIARQTGCRVVLPDLPAHGRSAHVAPVSLVHTASWVWDALSTWTEANKTATGEAPPILLAGYSLGGRVALAMAHARPDRVHGLFLESAHPGLTTPADRRARWQHDTEIAIRLDRVATAEDFRVFLEKWYRQSVFLREGRPPADMDARIAARMEACSAVPPGARLAAALRAYSLATQPDLGSVCAHCGPRTWYVSGAADTRYGEVGRRLAQRHAELRHVTIPGAGHTVHRDAPDAYLQTLQTFVTTCIS